MSAITASTTANEDSFYDQMANEREVARAEKGEHFFGPLPIERHFDKCISASLAQYNDGLINSLELFERMYLIAMNQRPAE
jgi:hypothetical protein